MAASANLPSSPRRRGPSGVRRTTLGRSRRRVRLRGNDGEIPLHLCNPQKIPSPFPTMDLRRVLAFSRYAERALAAFPQLADELEAAVDHAFDWTAPAASVT